MNCQEFWSTMPELARSGDSSGHLRECAVCAARWERQRELAAGLRAVAAEWSRVGAPARVEARLTDAFRDHAGLGRGRRAARRSYVWMPAAAWATAAALVALAMFLVSGRQPQPARRSAPGVVEMAAAQMPPDWMEPAAGDDPANAGDGFIPLPNAERIRANEELNLVRVEVPRSAMIGLGFAVSADRASEPVEAEVMLGSDGLARAVRFLD